MHVEVKACRRKGQKEIAGKKTRGGPRSGFIRRGGQITSTSSGRLRLGNEKPGGE